MVNTRTFIFPSRQTHFMRLRSRLYPSSGIKPVQVEVPTRCTRPAREIGPRFPFAESILAEATIQPYVHDCVVQIIEEGRTHQFRVFFKTHRRLRPNQSLPRLRQFHGDIVVMRAAALHPLSVVHMRERDTTLADYLVIRFARTICRAKGRRFPKFLTYQKTPNLSRRRKRTVVAR